MSAQLAAPTAVLRAHEELFAYWATLRRRGRLPSRSDIDPVQIKRHLPLVSLTTVIGPGDYRLRLAGTELWGVYGGEITGRRLGDIYSTGAATYWRRELDRVVTLQRPCVGHHNLAWRGASHVSLIWLRLPLSSDGCEVDIILGYDAVLTPRREVPSGVRAA